MKLAKINLHKINAKVKVFDNKLFVVMIVQIMRCLKATCSHDGHIEL